MRLFNFGTRTKEEFVNDTIAVLEKKGYKCTFKDENTFLIKSEDACVFAKMWETPDKGRWRVSFVRQVVLPGAEDLSDEGAAVFVAACNNYTEYTVAQVVEQGIFCHVMTNVGSSSDFMREFEFATTQINKTGKVMAENLPLFIAKFPKQPPRRPIGFTACRDNGAENESTSAVAHHKTNVFEKQ